MHRGFGYIGLLITLAVIGLLLYAMRGTSLLGIEEGDDGPTDIPSVLERANENADVLMEHNRDIEREL